MNSVSLVSNIVIQQHKSKTKMFTYDNIFVGDANLTQKEFKLKVLCLQS